MTMTENSERIDLEVSRNLRTHRVKNHMSQAQLGEKLNVTFQQIQKYEKGSNSVPTGRVRELCQVLGISPNELFGWEGASQYSAPQLSTWATKTALLLDALEDGPMKRTVKQLLNQIVTSQETTHAPVAQLVRASRS